MSAGDSEPALTPAELATLRAVMDRIVPADHDPGATGFGAEAYVTRMLAGDARGSLVAIRDGLAALRPNFVSLTPAEQDATRQDYRRGVVRRTRPADFGGRLRRSRQRRQQGRGELGDGRLRPRPARGAERSAEGRA